MPETSLRVLILEDNAADAELVLYELRQAGYAPISQRVDNEADYLAALDPGLDIVLADYSLPQFDALHALELLRERDLDIPFLLISGSIGEDRAVETMRLGAADYLLKDRLARLGPAIGQALAQRRLQVARRRAEQEREQLLAREQVARREAEALAALIASVAGSFDPAETMAAAVQALPPLLGASHCGIVLPGPDNALAFVAGTGDPDPARQRYRFEPGQGYVGRAFAERRVQRADDLWQAAGSHQTELDMEVGARAFLAAPLVAHGRALGVMTVSSPRPSAFTAHHEELLLTVARHLATALEAAQVRQGAQLEARQKAAILDQMADGVLVTDAQGRCILANPTLGRILDVAPETLLGQTSQAWRWQLFDEQGQAVPPPARPISRAGRGETVSAPFRLLTASDQEGWIWISATPLRDESGQLQGAVSVVRDLTEQRERQRRATEGEKLHALGQMASGIAHDFNNALSLIVGFSELLLARPDSLNDRERLLDHLRAINTAAEDAAAVVGRLRELYRLREPGERFGPLDLNLVVQRAVALSQPRWRDQALAAGATIAVTAELQAVPPVLGSEAELCEALLNLIFNAVDALPRGGSITLRTRLEDGKVVLEIADSGAGMTEAVRRRCLEPFFTTKGAQGSGIGLAMVHGSVLRHDGTLDLISQPGSGTTIAITLPAANASAPSPAGPVQPAAQQPCRTTCPGSATS
jgi:PAS domain S-box-containing protein